MKIADHGEFVIEITTQWFDNRAKATSASDWNGKRFGQIVMIID